MSCNTDRFTITKGVDNTFTFVIKETGTTLPMEIDAGDTFTSKLYDLENGEEQLEVTTTVLDTVNGKIGLVITEAETDTLLREVGDKVDRYYSKPVYRLVIECSTLVNGDFLAKVPFVYVE